MAFDLTHEQVDAVLHDPTVPGDVRTTMSQLEQLDRYLGTREFYEDDAGVTQVRVKEDRPDEPVNVTRDTPANTVPETPENQSVPGNANVTTVEAPEATTNE